MTPLDYIFVVLAAMGGGLVNAIAGGGTLITFPALQAVGLGAIAANVTNTVALLPGYLAATAAQRKDLKGQESRIKLLLPAGFVGGLVGAGLLLLTGEKLFSSLVPWLILLASFLLAIQDPVKNFLNKHAAQARVKIAAEQARSGIAASPMVEGKPGTRTWTALPIALAAVYGGYFGAGLSVIILAVLGLTQDDTLTRLNAVKQFIAASANSAAAVYFVFSGKVVWEVAAVMLVGSLVGGWLGGKVAGKIQPKTLRFLVVSIGIIIGLIYLFR